MEASFNPHAIERSLYAEWEAANYFAPQGGEGYCIVIPPPNVTGSLHMGHAFQHTLMDTLIRFQRMRGRRGAVADGHRPRRHLHANAGGAATERRRQDPRRTGPGEVHRTGVAVEAGVRRQHLRAVAAHGLLLGLVQRALHP